MIEDIRKQAVERRMPQSEEAEKGLLGSILLTSGELLDECAWLAEEHFYKPSHQEIFRVLREMRAEGCPIDMISVTERLSRGGLLETIGGAEVVTELFMFVPTASNWRYYAGIITEKSMLRDVIRITGELGARAYEGQMGAEQLVEECESAIMNMRKALVGQAETMRHIESGLLEAVNQIEAAYKNRGKPIGMPTGIIDFDRMTCGLKGGQLVIVAARPGNGKTTFAMQAALEMSTRAPVAVFSLEMNETELCSRLLCSQAPINLQSVRNGFMAKTDMPNLSRAMGELMKRQIYIDDTGALSTLDFRARARRAVLKYGVKAIVVDYLQLMRSLSRRAQENRALEVAEISMNLKACAKELNVPVIACAQLNRDAEQRAGRPKLSDLRESGQIEQDADIICFLHRPSKDSEDREERERCELVVAKHRDGPVNTVQLRFEGEFARFQNVTEKLYSNNDDKRQR